ncbi:MAG: hypothetical protein DRJ97_08055 [Thermoprotei archaeon]|nr:MAG: hypothetical protein DRJ97_08055 [Thermoprotei archaeon]
MEERIVLSPVLVVDERIARELGYALGEGVEASVADSTRDQLVRDALELALLDEMREEASFQGLRHVQ